LKDASASLTSSGAAEGDFGAPENQANCVVCLTVPKDTALMPCGHFCVCNDCGKGIRLAPGRNRCPLCRKEVSDIVRITVNDPSGPTEQGNFTVPEGVTSPEEAPLPTKCLQRLTRELRSVEEQRQQNLTENGVEIKLADPEGNDLRVWQLRLHASCIAKDCQLGKELSRHAIQAIEMEVWIPDNFPMAPPRLRILSPCFSEGSFFVQQHGALCLELLTSQGWSPSTTLPQLAVHVKTMMSAQSGGTVRAPGAMSSNGRHAAWKIMQVVEAAHEDWKQAPGL